MVTAATVIGAALALSAYGLLLAAGVAMVRRRRPGADRLVAAALLAAAATYAVDALYEWDWSIPGVTLPALVFLAALTAVLSQGAGLPLLVLVPLAVLAMPSPDGRVRWRTAAFLGVLGVAVAGLYVARLEPAPNMPTAVSPMRDLGAFGTWLVTYLGTPLAPTNPHVGARWGIGGLVAFVAAALWSLVRRPAERANLVLLDLEHEWTVGEQPFRSRSGNSWLLGSTLSGAVRMTLAGGAVVHE